MRWRFVSQGAKNDFGELTALMDGVVLYRMCSLQNDFGELTAQMDGVEVDWVGKDGVHMACHMACHMAWRFVSEV